MKQSGSGEGHLLLRVVSIFGWKGDKDKSGNPSITSCCDMLFSSCN